MVESGEMWTSVGRRNASWLRYISIIKCREREAATFTSAHSLSYWSQSLLRQLMIINSNWLTSQGMSFVYLWTCDEPREMKTLSSCLPLKAVGISVHHTEFCVNNHTYTDNRGLCRGLYGRAITTNTCSYTNYTTMSFE